MNLSELKLIKLRKQELLNLNLSNKQIDIYLIFFDIIESNLKIKLNTLIHISYYRINTFTDYKLTKQELFQIFNLNSVLFDELVEI